jgi:hypothetical protein
MRIPGWLFIRWKTFGDGSRFEAWRCLGCNGTFEIVAAARDDEQTIHASRVCVGRSA